MGTENNVSSPSSSTPVSATQPTERDHDAPLIPKSKPLSSQAKTFANIFISIVGAGVLGLPYAFKRTGWAVSVLMMFSVAALSHRCMMLLVITRRKLHCHKINSFGDLGFAICGSAGRCAVNILIILSQAGFCVGYLLYIGNTLANVLGLVSKGLYIWGCFPFQLGLNSIPTLTHLAPLSIFADVINTGAMAAVMGNDAMVMIRSKPEVDAFGGFSVFFYGIGVAIYAFEGICMVLPIESEMKDKENFGTILGLTMAFISIIYCTFGLLGYLAFGHETRDIITANMGVGLISSFVQVFLCINLFFAFPLMLNPVYEIIERTFGHGRHYLLPRWSLVLAITLVALLVPNFADFLSLIGSSVCCGLGFVLPSLFHFLVFREEMSCIGCSADLGIMLLGIVLGVSGTWSALNELCKS